MMLHTQASRPALMVLLVTVTALLIPHTRLAAQQPNRQPTNQVPAQAASSNIQVVAVVNGQSITRQHLAQQCAVRFGEDVLESMVNKMLILNQVQAMGISITEQDVLNELERQAGKYGLSTERYIALIQDQRDVSPEKLKRDIIWTELALRRLAAGRTQVSPDEIAQRMRFEFGPKVQVRAIAANDRETAEQLLAYVQQNPAEFGRVAKERSVDTQSAAVRGLLPPIRRNMGEPVLENAAFQLEEDQISPVIEAGSQFVILKCERHYPAANLPPEQRTLAEQRIAEQLREEKLGDAAAQMFEEMQSQSKIVNVYNDVQLRQQMPGVAASVNGTSITLDSLYEDCITRFGRDVLKAEINRSVVMQALQRANMTVSEADVKAEIDRAAVAFGFTHPDGSIDSERWIAYVTNGDHSKLDIYVQDEVWPSAAMRKLVEKSVQVTEEDLQKGFHANYGERVECLAIVLSDQRLAQRVWQMAKANPTEDYFGQLANQYSDEPASRANYGQVPPIQMYGGRPKLEEEAFSLQPGEISGLVQVGKNWIILLCQGRTTPEVQDFDAVKDELHRVIFDKKLRIAMAEEFDRLTQAAQIDNFIEGTSQPGAAAVEAVRQNLQQPNR